MRADPREIARHAGERLYHFPGGLRLRHHKKISCETPLTRTPFPSRLIVPLLQHMGGEATALVKEGDAVLKGQPIGRFEVPAEGFVHAATSGTVTAVARQPASHPSGRDGRCVIIKPDGLDRWIELEPMADWESRDREVLRRRIRDSGLVGLGGAVFPTGLKVDDAHVRGVHTLILNGAECEPFISCDEMLMREEPDRIITGGRVLQRAAGAGRIIIAIEDQMGAVNASLSDAVKRCGATGIDVAQVTTIYPEGGERQLIQVLTGLEVPSGGLPSDLGLLCVNVATAAAAADAVVEGKPLIERVVTIAGNGVRRPRNLIALIGTPVSVLIDQCGGYEADAARLILGGPMMGYSLASDVNPVIKAANCILVMTSAELAAPQVEMPCIRCGECARVCPAVLLPQQLNWQVRNDLLDEAADYGLLDCIECGCCDHVCPSHIPLAEWFRFGKSELRALQAERLRAQHSRERFEARQARLEGNKEERRQRLAEKKQALRDDNQKKRRIAEALERSRAMAPSADATAPAEREGNDP